MNFCAGHDRRALFAAVQCARYRLFQAGLSQCPLVRGLHFRQRRYDRRPDSPVDFLCILFGGGCDFNTAGGGRHQVKTALFARKKEVIGRRRHLLGLAIRVGASDSGCLDDVEGGAGEKIAAAPLRIASDDEVAQVGDFRRFVFWQDRYREQSIGDFPHRITINTLGDVIGLHARGVGNLCFGYNTARERRSFFLNVGIIAWARRGADRRLQPGGNCRAAFCRCSIARNASRQRKEHLIGVSHVETGYQAAGDEFEPEDSSERFEGVHGVWKLHTDEPGVECRDPLAESVPVVRSEGHVKGRALGEIPGRVGEFERPHVVAIDRIDDRDPVEIGQLGRTPVQLFFLLIPVSTAGPITNLECVVICSRGKAAGK